MRWLIAIVLVVAPRVAHAQALEVLQQYRFGVFAVSGRTADKADLRGGGFVDCTAELRSHGLSLRGGIGAHWAKPVSLMQWHTELGFHHALWSSTKTSAREIAQFRLDLGPRVGIVAADALVPGAEDDHTDAHDGWSAGASLDLRIGFHGKPGDVGYIMSVAVDVERVYLEPTVRFDEIAFALTLLGGGR